MSVKYFHRERKNKTKTRKTNVTKRINLQSKIDCKIKLSTGLLFKDYKNLKNET